MRLALVVEDQDFDRFLRPAILELAGRVDADVRSVTSVRVHGEAWLLSDVGALRAGLAAALGGDAGPAPGSVRPRDERHAKDLLGRTIVEPTGGELPLAGFELASEIVPRMDLEDAAEPSLRSWARDLFGTLRR